MGCFEALESNNPWILEADGLQQLQISHLPIFPGSSPICSLFSFCSQTQEKEMEKQRTLYQQARLHDRGAAEMVLQMISASKGNALGYL